MEIVIVAYIVCEVEHAKALDRSCRPCCWLLLRLCWLLLLLLLLPLLLSLTCSKRKGKRKASSSKQQAATSASNASFGRPLACSPSLCEFIRLLTMIMTPYRRAGGRA